MDTVLLVRWAGISSLAAIPALLLAALFGALFFAGAGERYVPLNDVFAGLMLLLLLLPALAIYSLSPSEVHGWLGAVTAPGVIGILVGAVGQFLLVAGVINLGASFVTGGVGFGLVFVWLGSVVLLALKYAVLSPGTGWLFAAVLVVQALAGLAYALRFSAALWVFSMAATAAFAAWLAILGQELLRRA